MNYIIYDAIKNYRVLTATYDGSIRTFEPQHYGCSAEGNEILEVWQTSDSDRSKAQSGWKRFSVLKLSDVKETGSKFSGAHPGYNPENKDFASTFERL